MLTTVERTFASSSGLCSAASSAEAEESDGEAFVPSVTFAPSAAFVSEVFELTLETRSLLSAGDTAVGLSSSLAEAVVDLSADAPSFASSC